MKQFSYTGYYRYTLKVGDTNKEYYQWVTPSQFIGKMLWDHMTPEGQATYFSNEAHKTALNNLVKGGF